MPNSFSWYDYVKCEISIYYGEGGGVITAGATDGFKKELLLFPFSAHTKYTIAYKNTKSVFYKDMHDKNDQANDF